MEIIKLNKNTRCHVDDCAVAIGYFDGLHLGHMQLICKVIDICTSSNLKKGFMTFDKHPNVIFGQSDFQYLMTIEEKQNIVEKLGFDYFFIIEFNSEVAQCRPEKFIDDYIVKNNIKHVVCGFDFSFGDKGEGHVDTLKFMANDRYKVDMIEKYEVDYKKVSSSLIRKYIHHGDIEKANQLLNRPYRITGHVIHGRKNGHKIGFPTANVEVGQYVVLKRGVYAVYITVNGKKYKGMANIGVNPTFGSLDKISLEVHIFEFDLDIYGEIVDVDFIEHIRNELHFKTIEQLVEQLNKDKKYIDQILD